jgi:plastocyanin
MKMKFTLGFTEMKLPWSWLLLLALLAVPLSSVGQWKAKAGAQFPDCLVGADSDAKLAAGCQAAQAMAFIPNEIWIHQNDTITWTMATEENHTVTFLYEPQPATLGVGPYPSAQQRPSNAVGCTAYGGAITPSGSSYDPSGAAGLQCVHSGAAASGGALVNYGDSFTVKFPAPGNFKFTCLIHASMNGTVHVVDPTAALPYSQSSYDLQTLARTFDITTNLAPLSILASGSNRVYTVGKVLATGGGWQYGSLFRFVGPNGQVLTKRSPLVVRRGQTVEFTNIDPAEPHTITFGCPTDDPTCPIFAGAGGFVDTNGPLGTAADGARFAVMNGPFDPADEGNRDAGSVDEINSGLITAGAQDRATGISPLSGTPGTSVPLAQVSPTLDRFRVTFNALGQYRFICELHDQLGMIGWVKVVP